LASWSRHDLRRPCAPADVFLDANTFIYHFTAELRWGSACTSLLERIELQELRGFTSTHVQADVAHRLMTIEAMNLLGCPPRALAARLRKHHAEIPRLTLYAQALVKVAQMGVSDLARSRP
jgi:predicted nucleic acid-binding protein